MKQESLIVKSGIIVLKGGEEVNPELKAPKKGLRRLTHNGADFDQLLQSTLRFTPHRIILGEIRGKEAFSLINAWLTGHSGGLSTMHANNAVEALNRLEQLIRMHPALNGDIPRHDIAFAVNGIISIQLKKGKRVIDQLREIEGFDGKNYRSKIFKRLDC